eukprot:499826-Alexandrium_andersonii.AAC.1
MRARRLAASPTGRVEPTTLPIPLGMRWCASYRFAAKCCSTWTRMGQTARQVTDWRPPVALIGRGGA